MVAGLVVTQVVKHALPHLQKRGGRDGVQVLHKGLDPEQFAAPEHFEGHHSAHRVVENFLQVRKQRHQPLSPFPLVVGVVAHDSSSSSSRRCHAQKHVSRLQPRAVAWALGHQGRHAQHPHAARVPGPHGCLHLGRQTHARELVEGTVLKGGLQRAPAHGFASSNQVHGPLHPVQGQVVRGGRAHHPGGVQGHDFPVRVDDGAAAGPSRGVGGGLEVEGVVVVERVAAVVGGPPVQARQRATQDRQLLPRVVPHNPDVQPHLGQLRVQRQFGHFQVPQVLRVELEQPKVVHRISVHGPQRHLLVVLEQRLRQDWARLHHMPVGQHQALLGVHHEPRGLGGSRRTGVEGAGGIHFDGDHPRNALLQHAFPPRRVAARRFAHFDSKRRGGRGGSGGVCVTVQPCRVVATASGDNTKPTSHQRSSDTRPLVFSAMRETLPLATVDTAA
mmetsp:Transcript_62449/g.122696  ORF Transcript_62449/g.122696 Transcript_62449/m.122696 type:complete len:445 (-) Transcript_62449:157-1491(-)